MLLGEGHRFIFWHSSSHLMLMRHMQLMMLNGKREGTHSCPTGNVEPTYLEGWDYTPSL